LVKNKNLKILDIIFRQPRGRIPSQSIIIFVRQSPLLPLTSINR